MVDFDMFKKNIYNIHLNINVAYFIEIINKNGGLKKLIN